MTEDGPRAGSCEGVGRGSDASCGVVRAPGLAPARGATAEEDQASEGHLVDALALRGDEGRSTLR